MLPILTALLLAAWIFHPWAAFAQATLMDSPEARPAAYRGRSDAKPGGSALTRIERMDTPAPTPAPTPTPTPPPTPAPSPPPPTPAPSPPPPAPAPTPVPQSAMPRNEIEALVCTFPWPCDQALRVMWCESGGKPWAIGRGANYGLFQINQVHSGRFPGFWELWMDPGSNINWAYHIWAREGWVPWGCKHAAY